MKRIATLASIAVLAVLPYSAGAATLSAIGAASFGGGDAHKNLNSPALTYGGELTFGLGDLFQIGPFYEVTSASPSSTTGVTDHVNTSFYGGVVRIGLPLTSMFLDAQLGSTKTSQASFTSDSAFGYGVGVGTSYSIVPTLAIKPRVGWRSVPSDVGGTSTSHSYFDAGILLSFSL